MQSLETSALPPPDPSLIPRDLAQTTHVTCFWTTQHFLFGGDGGSAPHSVRLRGTKEVHEKAENTQFVKDFLRGRIRKELFKLGAVALYFTYTAMEEEIERNKEHPCIAPLYFPQELHRHQALGRDLEYFYGPAWQSEVRCSPATRRYVDRIRHVGREEPALLVAHTYTRYMGDLSGGQVLGKVAQRALRLPPTGEGLEFYRFDERQGLQAAVPQPHERAELDAHAKQKIVAEAVKAFQFNMEVFDELEEMGKDIQEEVMDAAASGGAEYAGQVAMAMLRHPTGQVLLAAWVALLAGLTAWYLM
ncbi:LOW QUALITY PROTEIN: hypothetical protein CRUP_037411 [Coryphaenoides rupestris]|nr:LOW QUALITY PROTEIN: hypothetical protein CRUP_037411 [Coryphaenoides rupestris]